MRRELETVLRKWRSFAQATCFDCLVGDARHIIELRELRLLARARRHIGDIGYQFTRITSGYAHNQRQKHGGKTQ